MCLCSFLSCCLSWISRAHLAIIFLWTAGVLCSVSFVTPFWMIMVPTSAYIPQGGSCIRKDIGLLAECCATTKCTWVWENGFALEKSMPEWRRVTQFVFLTGLIILLPVLILSPFRFCCQCGRTSVGISRVFTVLSFIAAVFFGSGCIFFFYNIFGQNSISQLLTQAVQWSWAFAIGVTGTCFAFLSCAFWYFDSKRQVASVNFQNPEERNRQRRRFLKR